MRSAQRPGDARARRDVRPDPAPEVAHPDLLPGRGAVGTMPRDVEDPDLVAREPHLEPRVLGAWDDIARDDRVEVRQVAGVERIADQVAGEARLQERASGVLERAAA